MSQSNVVPTPVVRREVKRIDAASCIHSTWQAMSSTAAHTSAGVASITDAAPGSGHGARSGTVGSEVQAVDRDDGRAVVVEGRAACQSDHRSTRTQPAAGGQGVELIRAQVVHPPGSQAGAGLGDLDVLAGDDLGGGVVDGGGEHHLVVARPG